MYNHVSDLTNFSLFLIVRIIECDWCEHSSRNLFSVKCNCMYVPTEIAIWISVFAENLKWMIPFSVVSYLLCVTQFFLLLFQQSNR